MKTFMLSAVVGAAAAFVPARTGPASVALAALGELPKPGQGPPETIINVNPVYEAELGSQAPLGFYDPLGMIDGVDQERFDRLRYVEIKHGRVCMLAFLGQITTRAGIHLPGNIDLAGHSFASFPNGWAAINGPDAISFSGLAQLVFFAGILELFVMKDAANGAKPGSFVGDFRNGSLDFGWDTFDEETQLFKRGVELNNGRAAMLGILGLMVHEQLGGSLPIVGEM